MRIQDVVIHDSKELTVVHRGLFGLVTIAAWGVFAWLMQPVLTLIVWLVSGYVAYHQVGVRLGGIEPIVILTIGIIAVCCAVALVVWAEYNRAKYRGGSHREYRPASTSRHMATDAGMATASYDALSKARVISVDFSEDGTPLSVRVLRSPKQVPEQEGDASDGPASP